MLERCLWGAAGVASTLVGFLGLLIPIIPGLLFLLFAAVCFSRAAKPARRAHQRANGIVVPSFADELRSDLHQQYRRLARQLTRQQQRSRRR